jgi:hypothetical protein
MLTAGVPRRCQCSSHASTKSVFRRSATGIILARLSHKGIPPVEGTTVKAFLVAAGGLLLAASISSPVRGQTPNSRPAHPGSINYVEGQASIGNEPLNPNAVGSVDLGMGQTLTTQAGKVEILLTPGVFLRVADNSSVRMISPDLVNTEVALDRGRAMVEVLDLRKENNIRIDQPHDVSTQLLKNGLYDFDSDHQQIRVFKGTGEVHASGKNVKVTGERELTPNAGGTLKAEKFDTRQYEDDFFRWGALRSGYLSEAAADQARAYLGPGPGWYGPGWNGKGWYWDPWFEGWTFIPADGIFYSPFGWGFYSPIFVYRSPFFYGSWGHAPHHFGDFHGPYGHGFEPQGGFHGGGGFRGGGRR